MNTQDPKYQQKFKSIPSPEQYISNFYAKFNKRWAVSPGKKSRMDKNKAYVYTGVQSTMLNLEFENRGTF